MKKFTNSARFRTWTCRNVRIIYMDQGFRKKKRNISLKAFSALFMMSISCLDHCRCTGQHWVDHLHHLNHLNALGDFYQMFPFLPNDQSSPMELSLQLARKIPISVAQTPSPSSSLGQDTAICSRGFGLTNWSFCYLHLSGSPQVVEGLNLNKARQKK